MKILQLCNRVPFPPNNGGSIAMLNLTKSLKEKGNEIFNLSVNTPKHHFELKNLPEEMLSLAKWEAIDIDTTIKPMSAIANLLTSKSYQMDRFFTKNFEKKLISLLKEESFDIIIMESLFVTPYIHCIRQHSNSKIFYRAHNIEYRIWERMLEGMSSGLKKTYLKIQTNRLRKYESKVINSLDGIVTITPEDKEQYIMLGCKLPIHVTPIGIDTEDFSLPTHYNRYPVLFHLGSMNWLPNVEAMDWFIEKVWKKLHVKYPALKFYMGGRGMPEKFISEFIHGAYVFKTVNDAKAWMNTKDIMIVPLLSGSGMRVKIIEGMALGKTVISTTLGAEGIAYTHLKDILIADTPEEFIKMVDLCINDQELYKTIGRNAKQLVNELYNNRKIGEDLHNFCKSELLNMPTDK